ncbi:hypothetical protein BJ742DRAFT_826026, partial [Cladochytrium replicatum]
MELNSMTLRNRMNACLRWAPAQSFRRSNSSIPQNPAGKLHLTLEPLESAPPPVHPQQQQRPAVPQSTSARAAKLDHQLLEAQSIKNAVDNIVATLRRQSRIIGVGTIIVAAVLVFTGIVKKESKLMIMFTDYDLFFWGAGVHQELRGKDSRGFCKYRGSRSRSCRGWSVSRETRLRGLRRGFRSRKDLLGVRLRV